MSTWFSGISLILLQVQDWRENLALYFQKEGSCKNESTHLQRKSCCDGEAKTCGFTVLWVSIAHEVKTERKELLVLTIIHWIEEYSRKFNTWKGPRGSDPDVRSSDPGSLCCSSACKDAGWIRKGPPLWRKGRKTLCKESWNWSWHLFLVMRSYNSRQGSQGTDMCVCSLQ